jgi:hypothetical protein
MSDRTKDYFDDVISRARPASPIQREPQSDTRTNDCHADCEDLFAITKTTNSSVVGS